MQRQGLKRIKPQKTRPQRIEWQRQGLKRIEPQKTHLRKDRTAKTTPPTDQTAKDTPRKGSSRKDDAPNEPNCKKTVPKQKQPFRRQPVDNTGRFGRQWASSRSGKHGFGPAQWMVGCRNVYFHSIIGTMMGFHAVKQWQNETFHFLYHMNIIIKTHLNSRTGKMEAKNTS
jgi:hypothetical protein